MTLNRSLFLPTVLFIVLCFYNSLSAQFAPPSEPELWLKPSQNLNNIADSSDIFPDYFGAYDQIDFSDTTVMDVIDQMKVKEHGTYFVVYRYSMPVLQNGVKLFELGPVGISSDGLSVFGRNNSHPVLSTKETHLASFRAQFSRFTHMFKDFWKNNYLQVSEIIFYDHMLSDQQIVKVNSYLALKYSINITEGARSWSDPNLQHYLSIFDQHLWDSNLDSAYDAEIMALGRSDAMGFLQTNTFTADSRELQLELLSESQNGRMITAMPTDSSFLVMSRKGAAAERPLQLGMADLITKPWKIRLFNWGANVSTLRLTIDTLLHAAINPQLESNGNITPLTRQFSGDRTYFDIPIGQNAGDQSMYLVWNTQPRHQHEDPVFAVLGSGKKSGGKISLDVPPGLLPCQLCLSNGESELAVHVSDPHSLISNLHSGEYRLVLENEERQMIDSNFVLEINANRTGKGELQFSAFSTDFARADFISSVDESRVALRVFPIPTEAGKEVTISLPKTVRQGGFSLSLSDASGKVIYRTVVKAGSEVRYSFDQPGTYIVSCFNKNESYRQKVVVQ